MTSTTSEDSNPLDRLVEEFVERQRRGEHPALSVCSGSSQARHRAGITLYLRREKTTAVRDAGNDFS
jgi:hypothetical protein